MTVRSHRRDSLHSSGEHLRPAVEILRVLTHERQEHEIGMWQFFRGLEIEEQLEGRTGTLQGIRVQVVHLEAIDRELLELIDAPALGVLHE